MIPRTEKQMLDLRCRHAEEFAQDGELAAGFNCLANGLAGAEELQADGEPYATKLLQRYRQELNAYTARYGVPVG